MLCTVGCYPLSLNLGFDSFRFHFIVGAIGAVFLLHGCQKVFSCQTACVAGHYLASGAASRAGVRSKLGIVHNQFDLIRSDACLTQCFMCRYEHTHISALSMIFPGCVHGYCSVRIQLCVRLRCINTVKTAAVNTGGYTDTIFISAVGCCILFGYAFLACFVQRTGFLVHFFQTVYVRFVACRNSGAFRFFVAVQLTDIERVHAHFCCEYIDRNFRSHEGLR